MKIKDISDIVESCGFGVFADTVKNGGTVRAVTAKKRRRRVHAQGN